MLDLAPASAEELTLESVYEPYEQTLTAIGNGDFTRAHKLVEKMLAQRLDNPELFAVMKCLKFWDQRLDNLLLTPVGAARAQLLETYWGQFESFVEKYALHVHRALNAFKKNIFQKISDHYAGELAQTDYSNVDYLLKTARLALATGNYDAAHKNLRHAATLSPNEFVIKRLLINVLYLKQEIALATATLHHYFFITQPPTPSFTALAADFTAQPIWQTILYMRKDGFYNTEIPLWLPVYAVIHNLFPLETLFKTYSSTAPTSLPKLPQYLKTLWERELAFHKNKWQQHLLTPTLIYTYLFVLDNITLCQWYIEQNPPTTPPPVPVNELTAIYALMKNELPTLLTNLNKLNPFIYAKLDDRYAHFT